ncbi:hypothetical protein CISG_05839 [Coccidioides immitis RMSCC 3703]|uniref:Uncharacterized protein n=2 Tax=Coccidioides immitis TaxID=5501 RepID=A0A0J8QW49_COCIT|nr:hypothetical protein CIRG_10252 [Coccidioides immitis RMSCC 2394]KMU76696.1 hypothetical protein CISG_05839 [Coccidioides immitis RMSCC 3703]
MAAASALAVTSIRSTFSALDALRMRRAPVQIPVESLSELDGLSKAALKLFNPTPSTNYDLLISVLAETDEEKLHDLTSKRMKRMPFPQGLQRLCKRFEASSSTLVLSGGLLASVNDVRRMMLLSRMEAEGIDFAAVQAVRKPALYIYCQRAGAENPRLQVNVKRMTNGGALN